MPATVRNTRRGNTPPSQAGQLGGTKGRTGAIAGTPPGQVMQKEDFPAAIKGGAPLRFDFGTMERSIGVPPRPNSPLVANGQLIHPELRVKDLPPEVLRRLQPIPEEQQLHIIKAGNELQEFDLPQYYLRAADAWVNYSVTAGLPVQEELNDVYGIIANTVQNPTDTNVLLAERYTAPEAAEPLVNTTEPELFPTWESSPYTPEEDWYNEEEE